MPSLVLTVFGPERPTALVLLSVLGAMCASVALAGAGAAIWTRRPGSQDVVFGDLMLWGLLRRLRAERRLAQARELLGAEGAAGGQALTREELCETLGRLSALLEARDSYTHGHSRRVGRHAERIARELGLPSDQIAKVRVAAALHDVGKLHTPIEVLRKPDRLTDEEFAVIKRHPVDGAEMVAEVGDPEITAMVRHHHERLDGRGYPDGLSGDEIPLGARIIAVADTFDAITSSRPYRSATQHKKALDVLSKEAGSQLDADAVAAFMRYYSGKRSIAWLTVVVAAPQRLGSSLAGIFEGAAAAPLGQGALATGLAALAGATLGGPPELARADADTRPPALAREHVAAHHTRDGGDAADDVEHGSQRRAVRRGAERRDKGRQAGRHRERRARNPGGSPGGADDGAGGGSTSPESSAPGDGTQPGGSQTPPAESQPGGGGGGAGGTTPAPPPPDDSSPGLEVPDVQVPDVQGPDVDVPVVGTPEIDVPQVDVPGAKLPDVKIPSL